jgi:hypothetical protein
MRSLLLIAPLLLGAAQSTGKVSPTSDVSHSRVTSTGSTTARALRDHLATLPDVQWDSVSVGSSSVADSIPNVIATATGPNTIIPGHSSNAIATDVERSVILGGGTTGYNNVIGGDGEFVNSTTPNTTTLGTGAHVSVVGGYDNSAGQLSSKIISDHSKTQVGGQGHNAIYGGAINTITADAAFAGIFAGKETTVSAFYAFASGYRNTVSGQSGRASGDNNTVSGAGAGADGTTNTASGGYSYAHGTTNSATALYSRAYGAYAKARTSGQVSHSTGRFAANGDQQTSVLEMGKRTTDATITTLGYVGGNNSHALEANQSAAFSILLVARAEGGTDTAAWKIEGVLRRGASGTPVYVGTPTVTLLGADAGAATWAAEMGTGSDGGINVRITGEAGRAIRWVQRMTLVEVVG